MIRVALKGLAGRKLRAALTALAIVLGVAMISGTYVLTDTIKKGFDSIFTQSYANSDAVINGKVAFTNDQGNGVEVPSFPSSVLAEVRKLPDVAAAAGQVTDARTKLVGRNGKTIATHGAPGLAFSVDTKNERFNPLQLTSGSWPHGPEQIVIDKGTADNEHFAVGDRIGVESRGPVRKFRIVGIAKSEAVRLPGLATMAIFDFPTARDAHRKPGRLDVICVAARTA